MRVLKIVLVFSLYFSVNVFAQKYNLNDSLPVDNNLKIGKLANGLTYFIRKNEQPDDRVELRLVVNAGSILEDEDQRGLAHFTEHMAFNGTKHFQKNDLISYLQSVGVKFGTHLNAYTSFDETVYKLLVPTDKTEVVDKAFLVLEDWAHNITFDPQEIENERGIITEEWRIGRGAGQRLMENYLPVVYHKSQYAERLPIGKIDVITNFKHETIRRFYNDWYRPDLMAVIVVGDIDVAEYEEKIKSHFGKIPSRTNQRQRKVYEIPNHDATLFSINADKETSQTQIAIYSKTPHKDEVSLSDYRNSIIEQIYYFVLNQRFGDLARSAELPFISAKSSFRGITRKNDAFLVSVRVRENGVGDGLKSILEEIERAKRFGFTEVELERAKKSVALKYDRAFSEYKKTDSESYASELIRHYLVNEPIPGVPFEYEFVKDQLPTISLEELNAFDNAFLTDSNRVIVVTTPEKTGVEVPTEESLRKIINSISSAELQPYSNNSVKYEWKGKKPDAGKIVKEEKNPESDVTVLVLSNGAKVFLKQTDFKNNEISGIAYSKGGLNWYNNADYYSALYASALVNESGIANLTKNELVKAFAGKTVSLTPFINSTSEGINGKTSPKDLELFFQLLHLYFTQPVIDSVAFKSFITRTKNNLSTIKLNPQKYYEDEVSRTLSSNHVRGGGFPSEADLDKINRQRSLEIYKERFANAADFVFVFVGAFNIDSIKPKIETYIASLPAIKKHESTKDLGIRPPKDKVDKNVYKGSDEKSRVSLVYSGTAKYSEKNQYLLKSLNDILNIKLMESLRESKSGVYGVRTSGRISREPYQNYVIQIGFQCAPGNVDSLVQAAFVEIEKIKNNGVSNADINKVKETQKRELEVEIKSNAYWTNKLVKDAVADKETTNGKDEFSQIEKLTSQDIQQTARKYFGKNLVKIVLYPDKK